MTTNTNTTIASQALNGATITIFNTGRYYGDKGQRIACVVLPNARVAFYDLDRRIDGVTQFLIGAHQTHATFLPKWLMNEYDHGLYDTGLFKCCEQWRDLEEELRVAALSI